MLTFTQKHRSRFAAVLIGLFLCACVSGSRSGSRDDDVCGICGKDLGWVNIISEGKYYHPDCFENYSELHCSVCKKPIFGQYTKDNDGVYHIICFKETKLERCVVCNQPMEGEYLKDAWGQSAHKDHQGQPLYMCDACGRIICTNSKDGFKYNDGRVTCGICKQTAVMEEKTIYPVMTELAGLLGQKGIGPFSHKNIRVELVDSQTLDSHYTSGRMINKRGETVTSFMSINGENLHQTHLIRIQYGLPMTLFKGILAHEMLHVWLNENNVKMTEREIEGFCNLGILLVCEHERSDSSNVILQNLEQDTDEIYGEGYRLMKARLAKLGWPGLIDSVQP